MFDKLKKAFSRFEEALASRTISEKDLEETLVELEADLIEAEIGLEVVNFIEASLRKKLLGLKTSRGSDLKRIVYEATKDTLYEILKDSNTIDLQSIIESKQRLSSQPFIILFLGINGTGKTTTIAKIAQDLVRKGFNVMLAASDTYRAGAIEQLEVHAQRLGIKILKQRYGADPAAVARDAKNYAVQHGYQVVLIDTAGRMQTSHNLMEELIKIKRVVSPDITIFVGDALAGNDLTFQAKEFHDRVGFDGMILTKVDADVKGGAIINAIYATKKPILYLGTGQTYADLLKFDPEWVISRLLD